jgi:GR25 family glycosyltransferase involved in LPS biosynthesis
MYLPLGSVILHDRLQIRSFRGARSGVTQAFIVSTKENCLSWLTDRLGEITGFSRSPLEVTFVTTATHMGISTPESSDVAAQNTTRLNDVFERILVLNLDRRQDRWYTVSKQFARFGIQAERMKAVDGMSSEIAAEYEAYRALPLVTVSDDVPAVRSDSELYLKYASQRARIAYIEGKSGRKAITSAGAWGYLRSYEHVLERALEEQIESLLVFDDDVVLHNDFQAIFSEVMNQLPSNWLILQLGTLQYNWSEPWVQWRGTRLYQTNGSAIGSHAVGMRFDIYPYLLDHVKRMDLPYDVGALSAATHAFPDRCFVIYPNLAIQRLHDSDIGTSEFQKGRSVREVAETYQWQLSNYGL